MDIALRVDGERACFRRPEMRDDLISYDVMTPLAAEQILARLLDRRRWDVSLLAITALCPIRFRWHGGTETQGRSKRINALVDVAYVIEASVRGSASTASVDDFRQHIDEVRQGDIFLGLRDCPASGVCLLAAGEPWRSSLKGKRDLGWMIYDLAAARGSGPRFFRAELRDGRMTIPSAEEIDFAY